jgi:hypothetical protein
MSNLITNSLELLGCKAKDKISGFEGVVDGISFDLYGCVQATVRPRCDKDGKPKDAFWFDVKRLEIGKRVMPSPAFATVTYGKEIGPADKPAQRSA